MGPTEEDKNKVGEWLWDIFYEILLIIIIILYFSSLHAVVHAEVNAIMFRNCVDLEGCALYTTFFPCHECAKAIIWSGIKEIYYLTDYLGTSGDCEWDDPNVDDDWKENKDKLTYVASRYLLRKFYTSGKHQKVELMNGR